MGLTISECEFTVWLSCCLLCFQAKYGIVFDLNETPFWEN